MFGVVVDTTDTDVRVKFSDSRSNRSRDIRTAHFVIDERRRFALKNVQFIFCDRIHTNSQRFNEKLCTLVYHYYQVIF